MDTIDTICLSKGTAPVKIPLDAFRPTQSMSRLVHRLLASFALWLQKRESRCTLRDLTDDQLRDIGLTRSEAKTEVSKSFFWD
ncbi:DUF1127 domain-containing protein [Rhizobium lusitanum]|uniref:DUF1127 domain-containing protein n=1 Tax=Rhizobium lusitanum TaxID=293958 RepID=UPI001613528D|nr:DUF1127 domain-containing protein [Rhizobium lusitanum]QND50247.1 DUF1127 domain-containing protein [Rhizobium lusitanum]